VNAIGPQVLADLEAEQKKANSRMGRLKRKFRRS
jgi:hypothetical protein